MKSDELHEFYSQPMNQLGPILIFGRENFKCKGL